MRTVYKCTGCDELMPVMTVGLDTKERRCRVCGCKMTETASGRRLTIVRDDRDPDTFRVYEGEGCLVAAIHIDFVGDLFGDHVAETARDLHDGEMNVIMRDAEVLNESK